MASRITQPAHMIQLSQLRTFLHLLTTPSPPFPHPTFPRALQDPAAADKLTKIQRDLDETKIILHQTIDSVLRRGEKLDTLVDKSADLSMASQMFYKQARKTNACCKFM
jgi:synaptobrevin family protein YKT6